MDHVGDIVTEIKRIRSTEGEKGLQIENVQRFLQLRSNVTVRPERSAEGAESKDLAYLWPPPANAATSSPA